jgi:hypothetical protein
MAERTQCGLSLFTSWWWRQSQTHWTLTPFSHSLITREDFNASELELTQRLTGQSGSKHDSSGLYSEGGRYESQHDTDYPNWCDMDFLSCSRHMLGHHIRVGLELFFCLLTIILSPAATQFGLLTAERVNKPSTSLWWRKMKSETVTAGVPLCDKLRLPYFLATESQMAVSLPALRSSPPSLLGRFLVWPSGQSSWLQIRRSGFDSERYQIFWEAVGLEQGPLSPVSTTEELLGTNSSGSSS